MAQKEPNQDTKQNTNPENQDLTDNPDALNTDYRTPDTDINPD